jgi:hypothetical protein
MELKDDPLNSIQAVEMDSSLGQLNSIDQLADLLPLISLMKLMRPGSFLKA